MIEVMNYGLEIHFKGKTFDNIEQLEKQVCRRLGYKLKLNKPFLHTQLNKRLMVKVDVKEENHTKLGVKFIVVEKIEVVEI